MSTVPPRRESEPPAIVVKNVSKIFKAGDAEIHALQEIDLHIAAGRFVAVVGSSGCGKSTLLRLLGGLLPATGGEIWVQGNKVQGPDPETGIVFQTPVLLPWRTVEQNIRLPLDIRGREHAGKAGGIQDLIRLVGLEGFEKRMPYELSGGMQQRVALCRALIHDPSLLLMDEPFGALDALTREQMNLELQRIWLQTGKTVFFITHSIMEAIFLADEVVVMTPRPGRVREIVPVDLPRPRSFASMRDPAFHAASDRVRSLMNAAGMME